MSCRHRAKTSARNVVRRPESIARQLRSQVRKPNSRTMTAPRSNTSLLVMRPWITAQLLGFERTFVTSTQECTRGSIRPTNDHSVDPADATRDQPAAGVAAAQVSLDLRELLEWEAPLNVPQQIVFRDAAHGSSFAFASLPSSA